MNLHRLDKILDKYDNDGNTSSNNNYTKPTPPLSPQEQQEIEEARILLQQLKQNYIKAYNRRKEKWFKGHPDQKYFSPTLEEHRQDIELDEWFWYFIERVTSRTPDQRFQDERTPDYGWNHLSTVHSIDEDCREGCRFWPEEGEISDLEVLQEYRNYQDYDRVLKIWKEVCPN